MKLRPSDQQHEQEETKVSALKLNQAAPRRVCDSFCAADNIHLGEDGFTMRLDSAFTNK